MAKRISTTGLRTYSLPCSSFFLYAYAVHSNTAYAMHSKALWKTQLHSGNQSVNSMLYSPCSNSKVQLFMFLVMHVLEITGNMFVILGSPNLLISCIFYHFSQGHSSFVTHIDWSADSEFLQSNSGDYELLFWNAKTCKQVTSATTMRDTDWATFTCVLGFPVVGMCDNNLSTQW